MSMNSKLLAASSLTVTRYNVNGELPENFFSWAHGCIEAHAFRDIDDTYDTGSAGWVSLLNMFEPAHTGMGFNVGDYVTMTMRIDERKVPANTIKKFCFKEEERIKKERQIPKLSRKHRQEIKENMTLLLTKRAIPETQMHDIIWNLEEGVVYLMTHTNAAKEVFESLFKECFTGLEVVEDVHATAALRLLGDDSRETLEELRPVAFDLGSQVGQFGVNLGIDLTGIIADGHFLGKEFLTWLRYRAMNNPDALPLPVKLLPDVSLEFGDDNPEKVACKGGQEQPEVLASLAAGKQIDAARVMIAAGNMEYTATIKADRLRLSAINLPKTPPVSDDAEGMEGRILDRIGQVEAVHSLMDQLFKTFLFVRTDQKLWGAEVHAINGWVTLYREAA